MPEPPPIDEEVAHARPTASAWRPKLFQKPCPILDTFSLCTAWSSSYGPCVVQRKCPEVTLEVSRAPKPRHGEIVALLGSLR